MSNPIEKYLNESGRDVLLIEKDKFLNERDIIDLEIICREMKKHTYHELDRKVLDNLFPKLEYIRGLLK